MLRGRFRLVETELAAEEALPTPPAAEVAIVEQREPATPTTPDMPPAAAETAPPLRSRKCKNPRRGRKLQTRMGGSSGPPPKWPI